LAPAASPDLAYDTGRHNDTPMLLARHLDDRGRLPVIPFKGYQGSSI
jgi:hypothetical protein